MSPFIVLHQSMFVVTVSALLTFINIIKVKWAANGQSGVMFLSISLLLIIAVIGLVYIFTGINERYTQKITFYMTHFNRKLKHKYHSKHSNHFALKAVTSRYLLQLPGGTEFISPRTSFRESTLDLGDLCLAFNSAIFAGWGW